MKSIADQEKQIRAEAEAEIKKIKDVASQRQELVANLMFDLITTTTI